MLNNIANMKTTKSKPIPMLKIITEKIQIKLNIRIKGNLILYTHLSRDM